MLPALVCTGALLGACGGALPAVNSDPATTQGPYYSHGGPVRDHVSFVDHLRGLGVTVVPVSQVHQPFLHVSGTGLRLSGGPLTQPADLQSYNYDPNELAAALTVAEQDALGIGSDGSPKTMQLAWVAPPHFFRKERVIVIYVGHDGAMLKVLTDLLGRQFAGH